MPISSVDMFNELQIVRFCCDKVARLHIGIKLAFLKCEDRILFRVAYENEEILVLKALPTKVLHLCHCVNPSRHYGRKKLYHFLPRS